MQPRHVKTKNFDCFHRPVHKIDCKGATPANHTAPSKFPADHPEIFNVQYLTTPDRPLFLSAPPVAIATYPAKIKFLLHHD